MYVGLSRGRRDVRLYLVRRRDLDDADDPDDQHLPRLTQLKSTLGDMAALGVTAVVQPGFVHHLGGQVDGVTFDDAAWLPFGDLARAGVAMAASSDDPCTFHEPLRGAAHGATRQTSSGGTLDAAQTLGYEQWLRAYTAGAADAGNQQHERGRIAPGLRADLVVLDGDLDPNRPPTVAQTWVAGSLEYASAPSRKADRT